MGQTDTNTCLTQETTVGVPREIESHLTDHNVLKLPDPTPSPAPYPTLNP